MKPFLKALVLFGLAAMVLTLSTEAGASTPPPVYFEGKLVKSQECRAGLAMVGRPNYDDRTTDDSTWCVVLTSSTKVATPFQTLAKVMKSAFPELTDEQALIKALQRQTFVSITGNFYGDELILESVSTRLE